MISWLTGEPIEDPILREERASEWRRVKAIEDALRPADGTSNRFLAQAVRLAIIHDCQVHAGEQALAIRKTRTVVSPPIDSDKALAVFAHELGEILSPAVNDPASFLLEVDGRHFVYSLKSECAAWRWAIKTLGWHWNRNMLAEMEDCLRSYQPSLVKSYADLMELEAVLAEGVEAAKHKVRVGR